MSDLPTDGPLSEEQASLILKRATQLEAEGAAEVDVAELRKAAVDAGIPLAAFERAVTEVLASAESFDSEASESAPTGSENHGLNPPSWIRKALLGALGSAVAALGFVFGTGATDEMIPLSMVLAFLIVCGLVVSRRRDRSILGFESDLLALCVGLTLGWMMFNPVDATGILFGVTVAGSIAAVLGGLGVGLARPQLESAERSPAALLGDGEESVTP